MGRGGGNDEVAILREPRHREIRFDPATFVEPLCVDDPADRYRHVIRANVVEDGFRISALHQKFRKGALIEQDDAGPRCMVLRGGTVEPVLFAIGVFIGGRDAPGRVPVGALPARNGQCIA